MRVIQVLPKFNHYFWGGAESAVVALAGGLQSLGDSVEMWVGDALPGASQTAVGDVLVRRFWTAYAPWERKLIGEGKAGIPPALLAKLLTLRNAVVHVHCHNRFAASVIGLCRARRIPTVLSLHSRVTDLKPRWRYWLPNIYPIRAASAVTAVSDQVAAGARVVDGRRDIEIIANGVHATWIRQGNRSRGRKRLGIQDSASLILFVGRITSIKRVHVLVEAIKLCAHVDDGIRLAIVGPAADEAYATRLRLQVKSDKSLEGRVVFTGPVPHGSQELADIFHAADVIALPSEYEAQPVSIVEAWAAGRIVVVADVGGMGPMVAGAQVGRLWNPTSGSRGLADELRTALREAKESHDLGQRAAVAAERLSAERMIQRYVAVYERVLSHRLSNE